MKQLIRCKIIDKSILTDGITLPQDVIPALYDFIGKEMERGDKEPVRIVIDNQVFDQPVLCNINNSKEARKSDSLQFRWSIGDVGSKMRSVFSEIVPKLIDENGKAIKRKEKDITEHISIYLLQSHTILFECHMKLSDIEFQQCSELFDYLAAAKAKPFLILGGFSGTGKSQKVKELAYLTCPASQGLQRGEEPGNYCLISVKPNWHDSMELLGYYSSISKKYMVTDFMRFLVKAMRHPFIPFYVCLDEMNLAPVEEYLAEYLSVLESRKRIDGRVVSAALVPARVFQDSNLLSELDLDEETDGDLIRSLQQNGLCLPQNLVVVGTVNMDDTTNSFSRKVIDRAMTFEMKVQPLHAWHYFSTEKDSLSYQNMACPERFLSDQVRVLDLLKEEAPDFSLSTGETELNRSFTDFINDINRAIGHGKEFDHATGLGVSSFQVSYRVLNEAVLYYRALLLLYPAVASMEKVFNDILMRKVLPRIEGEQDRAKKPLEGLQKYIHQRVGEDAEKKQYWSESLDKIAYMLRPFQRGGDGFTTFWE